MKKLLQWFWPKRLRHRAVVVFCFLFFAYEIGPYVYTRALSPWRALALYTLAVSVGERIEDDREGLRIVCYNIAHGRGLAKTNDVGGSEAVRLARLDDIAALLVDLDADVVVLNEADFDTSWSHGLDQAAYLALNAKYPYVATLSNLDFQIGHRSWDFGNAVLSRYPIRQAYEIDMPGYARWETILAGKKRALFCEIEKDGGVFGVVAVHLSHRSEAVRVASADRLIKFAKGYASPLILAGDFNSTPTGYPGYRADERGQNAMDRFDGSLLFKRFPENLPTDSSTYTFRSDDPTRVIDWVMVSQGLAIEQGRVIDSTLSDHRPVVVELAIE